MEPKELVKTLLSINFDNQEICFYAFKKRFEIKDVNTKLKEELSFWKDVRQLLLLEVEKRKGKISGYHLRYLFEKKLNEIVENLEKV